jgi:anti-anti-sigma factor
MSTAPGFHVFETGHTTVVGFDGRSLNDARVASRCRDELLNLVDSHNCQFLVVDLSEVEVISSWILGILAAIRRKGVDVELYHPSPGMRGVLSVTHLDDLLHVRHEPNRPAPTAAE